MKNNLFIPLLTVFIIFAVWEVYTSFNADMRFILPSPSQIMMRIWSKPDRFWLHSIVTLKEMAGGIALALITSFPLALLMNGWSPMRFIMQPLFVILQCIPMFVLAPIAVLWFGWSYIAIVIPTALMIFFPLTMNVYKGLGSAPEAYLDYFRINQATIWQTFWKLRLPWAAPYIFSGLRVSVAIAGIGAVAGEWAGGQLGLGVLMLESRRATDLDTTFGGLFCLAGLSLAFYSVLLLMEKGITSLYFRNIRRSMLISLIFIVGFNLAGCQNKEDQLGETKMLLDWLPNPNHVPLYAGIEKGIFRKHGIHLNLMKLSDPSETIPFLTTGQTDLALYYMPETCRAIVNGAKISPVGVLIREPLNGIIFRNNETISRLLDLQGKKIGYCGGGFGQSFLNYLLGKNRIVPSEKINVSFDLVGSLGLKKVDAIYGAYWNIEVPHLNSLGISTNYFTMEQLGFPPYYELIVVALTEKVRVNPGLFDGFSKALQESLDWSKSNPEAAFEIYKKANPDKSEETLVWESKAWNVTYPMLSEKQMIQKDIWENFLEWLKEL